MPGTACAAVMPDDKVKTFLLQMPAGQQGPGHARWHVTGVQAISRKFEFERSRTANTENTLPCHWEHGDDEGHTPRNKQQDTTPAHIVHTHNTHVHAGTPYTALGSIFTPARLRTMQGLLEAICHSTNA